jgi:hypothetical protein
VVISTWDKPEIKVDVEIYVRSSTEEKAQGLLDEIDVTENHDGNEISYKTNIGEMGNNDSHNKNKNKNTNKTFHIDYKVYMPAANRLQLENSFGKIVLPDFNGEVNLTSKFGGLTAGKLSHVDAIDVEFGWASIGHITGGKLTFKFDSESTIGRISGSVKINTEFSNHVQFVVDNDIEDLVINESYSTIRMVVDKKLSASFDIHTSFGNLQNETDFAIKENKDPDNDMGPHFDKDFAGRASDGKARIKIKSSFGTVKLAYIYDNSFKKDNKGDKGDDKDDDDDKDQKTKEPA